MVPSTVSQQEVQRQEAEFTEQQRPHQPKVESWDEDSAEGMGGEPGHGNFESKGGLTR